MRVTLEQWRSLVAVVDCGGYAPAAAALNKSQSAVTYAVQKLESALGVTAFALEGRKSALTPTGQMLYRRARTLIDEADALERAAGKATAGWEAEIALAVEVLFPTWLLLRCLDRFGKESPHTRIELLETVIGGAPDALRSGRVDLAISPHIPPEFGAEQLTEARFAPVAQPDHPLHALGRPVTLGDLRKHRHIVVRDSGPARDARTTSVEVDQRWTVTNLPTSIGALCRGYGFAWMPLDKVRSELDQGLLKVLSLRDPRDVAVPVYLSFADRDAAGPGVLRLAEIIRDETRAQCRKIDDTGL